ncbi:NADPH:quinone oxidoreductase family protein [Bradyrhizobium tropiciagri]|uniref:NADPH:quinone oxidoreductase family protein n=1 Tax=Bradyrhizobium tropiciagri TaxID=312253 RepID=UPI001BA9EE72|nr:NADPH:quinone oxidoreductase family protein [Bradyrhizobium tropiciagri]
MKAWRSRFPGGPETLSLEDVPASPPGAGQVSVRVKACGINYPDLLLIQDRYQVKPARPFSPGSEISGIVEEVGAGVSDIQAGERVAAQCGWGGMVESIVLDRSRCVRVPQAMSFEDAATFNFTFDTAYHALFDRAKLRPGETVLVTGAAGGIGLASVQLASAAGARVIAIVSSVEKLKFAQMYGASDGVVYDRAAAGTSPEWRARLKSMTGDTGADVVVDPVGGFLAEAALRCTAEYGRFLVIGFTAGIPSLPMNLPLLKSCNMMGINWRTFTLSYPKNNELNQTRLFRMYEQRLIKPAIAERFNFDDAPKAIGRLDDPDAMGKIVVVT